jgi:hypothetical protein
VLPLDAEPQDGVAPAQPASPAGAVAFHNERGDIVVTDAPARPTSKDECKSGGWRNYPGFKNQGECVSLAATAGKDHPAENGSTMSHKSTLRHGAAALAVALLALLGSAASAPAATTPTVTTVSACTDDLAFGIEGSVTGLEPNTSYGVQAVFSWGGTVGTIFTTDGTGSSGLGGVRGPSPFELRVVIWLNPDDDFDHDPGEPTVYDQTLVVDRPCEPAWLKLPTSKGQCKNGGWKTFGVFDSQGACVSSVTRPG